MRLNGGARRLAGLAMGALACVLLSLAAPAQPSAADARVALVIGNAAYKHARKLANPGNDAADVAAALANAGFRVIAANDLDKAGFEHSLREFERALLGAEAGVFFYRGHGVQVAGQNYLMPVDAHMAKGAALDAEAVGLDRVYGAMQAATIKILFLDASRDYPLESASVGSPPGRPADFRIADGTLISYSVQPGAVTHDGEGRNSPYTAALMKRIATPGADIASVLAAVRNDVMAATGGRQVPWETSSLRAPFYLVKAAGR